MNLVGPSVVGSAASALKKELAKECFEHVLQMMWSLPGG